MSDGLGCVFRREAGRCTATLIRVLGDIDLAEDAVAEAFAIAAERWSIDGIPPNPGGWIMTTARNRAIDRLRRESSRTTKQRASHQLTLRLLGGLDTAQIARAFLSLEPIRGGRLARTHAADRCSPSGTHIRQRLHGAPRRPEPRENTPSSPDSDDWPTELGRSVPGWCSLRND